MYVVSHTSVALITSVALRTALVSVAALVVVARPAHRKLAHVARREHLSVLVAPDLVPTHTAMALRQYDKN